MNLNSSELWFGPSFLNHPPAGWTVDWDHIDHTTPLLVDDDDMADIVDLQ